jgi:PAS domain S-box-containing protein
MARFPNIETPDRSTRDDFEARYELLVEHAPIGMCEVSRTGRLRWVNRALAEMLGYDSGREFLDADTAAGGQPPLIDEHLFSQFATPARGAAVETEWRRKDGTSIAVRLRGRAVRRSEHADELPVTAAGSRSRPRSRRSMRAVSRPTRDAHRAST